MYNWTASSFCIFYRSQMVRLEEKLSQEETHYKEKANECSQLIQELDDLRTESNRTNGRYKERSESLRRYLQMQISALEHQLIQSRAQCRAFQKERDEVCFLILVVIIKVLLYLFLYWFYLYCKDFKFHFK